jgi:tetratricopeptide (TPR) repeat protein
MNKIIIASIIALSFTVGAYCEEIKPPDQNKLFYSANNLYEKRDYSKALEEYKKILDSGIDSGPLYYNMANSYFKLNKLGYAILYYEKAQRVMPQDGDLKANLGYAKSLVQSSVVDVPKKNPIVSFIKNIFKDMNLNATSVSALVIYFIFILLQLVAIINPVLGKKLRFFYTASLIILFMNLGAFAIRYYDEEILKRGIVVQKDVECKYEPIDKSTTFYRLREGDEVAVTKTREGWRQVKRIDGKMGWVKQEAVEEI